MTNSCKPALSFKEQVALLRSRGLIIKNGDKAEKILSRVNYYKISGYSLHLREDDVFFEGVSFDDIYRIYLFDKRISGLLMDLIETVEVSMKTRVAYYIAHTYSPIAYLDVNNFDDIDRHNKFILKYIEERDRIKNKVLYIEHNLNKYGHLPVWVGIEFLSFGTVSALYENMKPADKKKLAKDYFGLNTDLLQSWFHSISNVRNRCAHHTRIYNTYFTFALRRDRGIRNYQINNKSLFAVFYVLKILIMNDDQWKRILTTLKRLISDYQDVIELSRIGFPENWLTVLNS